MSRKTELLMETFELIRDLSDNLPADRDFGGKSRREWTFRKTRLIYLLILNWMINHGKQAYELFITSRITLANVLVRELVQLSATLFHLLETIEAAVKERRVDRLDADLRRFMIQDQQDRKVPLAQEMLKFIEKVNRRFSGFFTAFNELQLAIAPDYLNALATAETEQGQPIDPERFLEGSQAAEVGAKNFHSALIVCAFCRNRMVDLLPMLERLCEPPPGMHS
ncbi:MAG TPA: hypothetical protein PKO06_21965 [Candidatus Ozemobacteraceae bacterium]|mgnify:CR=1 FL=1|nr:hypothetical protein [Candidatus Ozemobacteraceae bacterium]